MCALDSSSIISWFKAVTHYLWSMRAHAPHSFHDFVYFFFNVWFHIWSQEVARQKTIHLLWLWRGEFPEFGRSPPLWRNTFPRTQSPFDARTHLDQGLSKRDVRSWTTIAFVPKGYNVSCVSFLFFFSFLFLHPSLTFYFHLASLLDLTLSGSPSLLPPSSSSSLAATGWLAEMPGPCARLISTTAPTSASASPTTWGGTNQWHGGRGAELQIALRHEAWNKEGKKCSLDRRAGRWNHTCTGLQQTTSSTWGVLLVLSVLWHKGGQECFPVTQWGPKRPSACSKTHKSEQFRAKERKRGETFASPGLRLTRVGPQGQRSQPPSWQKHDRAGWMNQTSVQRHRTWLARKGKVE